MKVFINLYSNFLNSELLISLIADGWMYGWEFNTLSLKGANLVWDQSDYSKLKTVHNNCNSHKQSMQVNISLFLNTFMP